MGVSKALHTGKPSWLKTPISSGSVYYDVKKDLRKRSLVTVCEEAKCPNIGECWSKRTATFMVLGDVCTRACRFCNVKTGNPQGKVNINEPYEVAASVKDMKLSYVVLTMVDRDDLGDGGSHHVIEVVSQIRRENPEILVEVLAGDFAGDMSAIEGLLGAKIQVYAHNIETVSRLSPRVRDGRAHYDTSLKILQYAKKHSATDVLTKSSMMLGLGEANEEVKQTMIDLRTVGCDLLTLGQYMRPSKRHLSVKEWVTPTMFDSYARMAKSLGFKEVMSHPLARSSYKAKDLYQNAIKALS